MTQKKVQRLQPPRSEARAEEFLTDETRNLLRLRCDLFSADELLRYGKEFLSAALIALIPPTLPQDQIVPEKPFLGIQEAFGISLKEKLEAQPASRQSA